MKLFVDSADIEVIQHAFDSCIVDGVTTNPSLIKKAMKKHNIADMREYIFKILDIAKNAPVSLEVIGGNALEMYDQATKLYSMFKTEQNQVVIKIPLDPTVDEKNPIHFSGLKVIKRLSEQQIPTNVTLIFTPEQALLAAKAGATYVSPFAGRIDDKIRTDNHIEYQKTDYFPAFGWKNARSTLEDNGIISGVNLVEQIVQIFRYYKYDTQVLAASLRNARQLREVALVGSHVATASLPIILDATQHVKTEEGMEAFLADVVPEYEELFK